MTAVVHISVDPVAIQLGALAVHWYGILYAVAFAAGFRYGVLPHLLPRGVSRAECDRMLVWAIVAGLLGARFYYVVQQPLGDYLRNPVRIIAVWEGGMDFFGAIFAALYPDSGQRSGLPRSAIGAPAPPVGAEGAPCEALRLPEEATEGACRSNVSYAGANRKENSRAKSS